MRAIDSDALKEYIKKTDLTAVERGALLQAISNMPTLTPPNEWVNRVRELDELYTKLQIVTGFTAEQLLEIFAAGYTLEKPDYSKKFAEMENLAEAAQPNEPLTIDKKRVIAESCLHYGKSGRCGLNGYAPLDCPRCKEWHSNESNEPLTIEQLREMDKITPVWWTRNGCRCLCERGYITMPNGDIYGADEMNGLFYRRPPEVSP